MQTSEARWFSFSLTRANAPWVFAKGEPFKVIATLELLAVVIAMVCFAKDAPWKDAKGVVVVPGITDNKGNSYLVDRLMTTKFPLNVWLMELAVQRNLHNVQCHFAWHPREQNVEADALSNGQFTGFNLEKRIVFESLEALPFAVVPGLMHAASDLDAEIRFEKK